MVAQQPPQSAQRLPESSDLPLLGQKPHSPRSPFTYLELFSTLLPSDYHYLQNECLAQHQQEASIPYLQ